LGNEANGSPGLISVDNAQAAVTATNANDIANVILRFIAFL
jgi:hypothetical protein